MEFLDPKFPTWSAIVRYAVISAINLAILVVGMALGVLLAPHIEKSVSAHPPQAQIAQPQATATPATPETQYEDVTPAITVGSMATNTLLAHRIAADQIMVNGYDLAALDEGLLNLLKNRNLATFRELDAIIERAKVSNPLRLKLPPQLQPQPPTPEQKKP